MGRPRTGSHKVDTRDRILAAAQLAFASQGFSARLGDIASEAGIRRSSLLYHFGSKEGLYEAVVTGAFAELGHALRGIRDESGDFEARFEAMTRAFVDFVDARPAVAKLVVREMVADAGPGPAILVGQVAPLLDEIALWIGSEGSGAIRPGLPVRPALLGVVSDVLLAGAAGAARDALWKGLDPDRTWLVTRLLFLSSPLGELR